MSSPRDLLATALRATQSLSPQTVESFFDQPTIIVSVPRSGSSVLFEQMRTLPGFWSIGGESHSILNAFPGLRAENPDLDSGCLGKRHADEETCDRIRRCFLFLLSDHQGRLFGRLPAESRPRHVTLLEKTPRNALNIPFLKQVFPSARFLFLYRQPQPNIASLIEAWSVGLQTGRFVTFRDLPDWDRPGWCFLLPPGWRRMRGKSLADIAAFQWSAANTIMLDELEKMPRDRWKAVSYEAFIADPGSVLNSMAEFSGITAHNSLAASGPLPLSRTTLTPPDPRKWRKHEAAIDGARSEWEPVLDRLAAL
jgi:hypothetical protein